MMNVYEAIDIHVKAFFPLEREALSFKTLNAFFQTESVRVPELSS